MSELKQTKFIVLCSSRIALPGIAALHQSKSLAAVVCLTRQIEFEGELLHFTRQAQIPLKILEKHKWKLQLEEILLTIKPDAVLVKTFSYKIPDKLIEDQRWKFINFHYALLPQFRGAFPLYEVLKRQEPYGGVSVHYLTDELDKGPLIMQQYVQVHEGETYGAHERRLAEEGARLALQLSEMFNQNDFVLPAIPQDETLANSIAKPDTADLIINWQQMTAKQIVAMVLATNPWAKGAIASWNQTPVQILFARMGQAIGGHYQAGQIVELTESKSMLVACLNGESILIDVIYLHEGYLPAFKLIDYHLKAGFVAD